jgi:aldehyde dehydrogenase (NAD+)
MSERAVPRFAAASDREYPMFIDGEHVVGAPTSTFRCVDPYENTEWGTVYAADEKLVDHAVTAAVRAFDRDGWSSTPQEHRAELLNRLADLIDAHADELTIAQIHENGKLISEMSAGVVGLAMHARYVAGLLRDFREPIDTGMAGIQTFRTREPIGVVAAITPWNSPLTLLSWKLFPALAAGCTVVIKPSEVTPTSTLRLAELCDEAGFPPGVVNVVTGFGEPATALVNHPAVAKVAFTGSTRTGKQIMRSAADRLTRLTLELGGKSPQLVFADADIDNAVHGVMAGVFAATGQTCLAGSRVLVDEVVYDDFVSALATATAKLALGDPLSWKVDVGPLANRRQLATVLDYLELGAETATLVAGGRRAGGTSELDRGLFVEPTIFADVDPASRIAREEIFGPVVTVSRFGTEDEAIELANDTDYGLAAGVWSADPTRIERVSQRLRVGTVWANTYRVAHFAVPFGGYKHSGLGRELGADALDAYTEVKSVWVDHGNTQTFGR